jgi:hypothetical protein
MASWSSIHVLNAYQSCYNCKGQFLTHIEVLPTYTDYTDPDFWSVLPRVQK